MLPAEPLDDLRSPLEAWLATHLPAASVEIGDLGRPGSGFSAETIVVAARVTAVDGTAEERTFVVRKQSADPPVYPVQVPGWGIEVALQYEIMAALGRHSEVPVAAMIGYEADPAVLGTPFFVMVHVAGNVPVESPPYTEAGFFVAATPEQRTTLLTDGVATMAKVHAVDWRAAGLGWLVAPRTAPGLETQLALWERYAYGELAGRVHPLIDRARDHLHAYRPPMSDPVLCWGDPRPGNMIWGPDFTCRCATDFEAASIGPAESDVGWWLLFDRTMHESVGRERLPGDIGRAAQKAVYEQAAGRDLGDLHYWEVFAGFRYAAIVVKVMNRAVARGLLPADQEIWLHNPAADALGLVLGGG